MNKVLIFAITLQLFTAAVYAQPTVGIYTKIGSPVGSFAGSRYNTGAGAGFEFLSGNFAPSAFNNFMQLRAGAGFDFSGYGSRTFNLELAEPQQGTADVRITNSAFAFTPVLRASFGNATLQPYTEAFCGWNFFSTSETITPKIRTAGFEDKTETEILNKDAFYYGISTNTIFKLNHQIFANVGVSYLMGNTTQIQPLKHVEKIGNELNYNPVTTPTDMVVVKIGITVRLQPGPQTITTGRNTYDAPATKPAPKKPSQIKKNPPVAH